MSRSRRGPRRRYALAGALKMSPSGSPWPAKPSAPLASARVVAIVESVSRLEFALRRFIKRVGRRHPLPGDVPSVHRYLRSYVQRFSCRGASDEEAYDAFCSGVRRSGVAFFANGPVLHRQCEEVICWVRSFRTRPRCKRSRDRRRVEAAWRQLEAALADMAHHLRKAGAMQRLGYRRLGSTWHKRSR